MTVKVRPYKRGGREVDIMLTIPGQPKIRDRKKAPVTTKSAAKRWGEERERQLIQHYTNPNPSDDGDGDRPSIATQEVPTLAQFFPRYIEGHCKANRLRPSTLSTRTNAIKTHLLPAFGRTRLDRITAEQVQKFKADRSHLAASTVNQLLVYLGAMLTVAKEWGIIQQPPIKIRKIKEPAPKVRCYDFPDFDRLVVQAEQLGKGNHLLTVLLGGEAGLRCGEMIGLQWNDIDFEAETITIARAIWRGHEGPPKGNRARTLPLAPRLAEALRGHRHFKGPNVLWSHHRRPPSDKTVSEWLKKIQQATGLKQEGPHILRHTFCSHLAMAGVPVTTIQEFAGHRSLKTTQRYMHLAPASAREAIEKLRRPPNWRHGGDERSPSDQLQ